MNNVVQGPFGIPELFALPGFDRETRVRQLKTFYWCLAKDVPAICAYVFQKEKVASSEEGNSAMRAEWLQTMEQMAPSTLHEPTDPTQSYYPSGSVKPESPAHLPSVRSSLFINWRWVAGTCCSISLLGTSIFWMTSIRIQQIYPSVVSPGAMSAQRISLAKRHVLKTADRTALAKAHTRRSFSVASTSARRQGLPSHSPWFSLAHHRVHTAVDALHPPAPRKSHLDYDNDFDTNVASAR